MTCGRCIVLFLVVLFAQHGVAVNPNVNRGALSTCSKPGTALTGFTRDGHCVDSGDDDQGSHHICIEMKPDFCTVTGQPNWCGEKMECMGGGPECAIGNWCVCQWAFARYIQMAGGCDSIVDIVCDATNMAALNAYKQQAPNDASINTALECLEKRCNIPATARLYDAAIAEVKPQNAPLAKSPVAMIVASGCAVLLAALFATIALPRMRQRQAQRSSNDDTISKEFCAE